MVIAPCSCYIRWRLFLFFIPLQPMGVVGSIERHKAIEAFLFARLLFVLLKSADPNHSS